MTQENIFTRLESLDVNEFKQVRSGTKGKEFDYLSWADAEAYLYREFPNAKLKVTQDPETALPYFPMPDNTALVHVTCTIEECERECWYSVIDHKMSPVKNPSASDIANAIQRAKVKAIAMHGLGLYIYRGEDIPPNFDGTQPTEDRPPVKEERTRRAVEPEPKRKEEPKPKRTVKEEVKPSDDVDLADVQDELDEFDNEEDLMSWYEGIIKEDKTWARKIFPLVTARAKELR
jgi:hypothetical protein